MANSTGQLSQSLLRFGADRTARTFVSSGWFGVAGAHAQRALVFALPQCAPCGAHLFWCRVVQQFAEKLEMFSPQVGLAVLYGYTEGYSQSTLRLLRQMSSPQVSVGYPMGVLSAAHVSTHSTPCEYSE